MPALYDTRGFGSITRVTHSTKGGGRMTNPLDSIWGTIISGFVLTAVLYVIVRALV